MRFGISATSLMCPKNLRTRLRPVNVCCAIVASRYRHPLAGRHVRGAASAVPGLNFDPFREPEDRYQGLVALTLFFRPSKRKTTRGATSSLHPSESSHCGLQKPEIACLPTTCGGI